MGTKLLSGWLFTEYNIIHVKKVTYFQSLTQHFTLYSVPYFKTLKLLHIDVYLFCISKFNN